MVLDWITPRDTPLVPPLSRNIKTNRGFHHSITGALLCPAGLDWRDAEWVLLTHIFSDTHGWFSVRTKLASRELIVCGNQWPMLVYAKQEYDPKDPWNGLFRSQLPIWVSSTYFCVTYILLIPNGQAYKHIFTSPSSVEKKVKATRSGNAWIHGMKQVTTASLAYVATQVCLAVMFCCYATDHLAAPLCTVILLGLLQDWHYHRLGRILR